MGLEFKNKLQICLSKGEEQSLCKSIFIIHSVLNTSANLKECARGLGMKLLSRSVLLTPQSPSPITGEVATECRAVRGGCLRETQGSQEYLFLNQLLGQVFANALSLGQLLYSNHACWVAKLRAKRKIPEEKNVCIVCVCMNTCVHVRTSIYLPEYVSYSSGFSVRRVDKTCQSRVT